MSRVLDELLELLELERIEENLFRGHSQDLGFGAVFGGQVIGQALSAARHTVTGERPVHSFHCYFLRPGDARRPVVYDVEAIRDGRSVSTRRVKAIQRGQPIFFMTASFHDASPGLDHQDPMPDVTGPEALEPDDIRTWCRTPCGRSSHERRRSRSARSIPEIPVSCVPDTPAVTCGSGPTARCRPTRGFTGMCSRTPPISAFW